jgi:hypothetical protein
MYIGQRISPICNRLLVEEYHTLNWHKFVSSIQISPCLLLALTLRNNVYVFAVSSFGKPFNASCDQYAPTTPFNCRESIINTATGYGLDDRRIGARVLTGTVVHSDSYPMGTGSSFPGSKAAGAWSWSFTSYYCRGQGNLDLYIHAPIRLNGVVHRDNFTFTFTPVN